MARNEAEEIMENVEQEDAQEAVTEETTADVAPVDDDEGMTIIDNMEPADGDTVFSVAKGTNKSYLAFNFGADLEEMTEKFGAEIVFGYAKAQMIVKAQAVTRPFVEKGISAVEVINTWVPGVKRAAGPVDKKAAANDFVETASLEDLEAMLAKIKARQENA